MQRIYEGLAQLFYSAREDDQEAKVVVDEAAPRRVYPAETVFDDVPTAAGSTLTIERLCAEQLASGRYEGDGLVAAVRRNGFAVVRLSDAQHGVVARMFDAMAAFLRQPAAVKQRSFGRFIEGCRCGWELVDFPNEDNKRWPETRDAFSISPRFADQTPWPSPEFAAAALDLLALYTQLADAVLAQLAVELQCPVEHLTRLAVHEPKPSSSSSSSESSGDDAVPMTAQRDSEQSNLTLFRYQDDDGVLPAPQKCMIHQDSGLVTLLARATVPGLEVLLPDRSAFVDVESLLDARDVVVYFGKVMKRVTRGVVPATFHRVVRQPATERLSMPFELKPNNAAVLDPIASSPLVRQRAADLVDDDPVSVIGLHPNICNGCGLFVEGTLYRCRSCDDFDFCRGCYDEYSRGASVDNVHPDRTHAFFSSNDATWNFQRYDSRLNGWEFLKSIQHVRSANRAWRFRQLAGQ